MSKSSRFLLQLMILLLSISPKSLVFCSPVQEQGSNRPDPLRNFKSYNGGYDIRNKHYWASVAFTGVHGYAMAGIWILGGLGFGIFVVVKNYLRNSSSENLTEHSDSYYFIQFSLVVLFTFLAIVASSFTLAANRNFLWRTKKIEQTLLGAAGDARQSIRKVAKAMQEMQQVLRPYNETKFSWLNSTSVKLEKESRNIRRVVYSNRRSIDLAIKISYGATVALISINMVFVVFALGGCSMFYFYQLSHLFYFLLLLHWRPGLIMIIFLCWIFTTGCWVLTGFHFFLHSLVEDTCSAFRDFEQKPDNNSLNSVLPCVNHVHAHHIMIEIGSTVHKFINKLNSKMTYINRLLELNEQNDQVLSSMLSEICNPFSGAPDYIYDPSSCPNDAISVGDIPKVLAQFTCYNDSSTTVSCKEDQKFIAEPFFDMAWAYSQTIQGLINIFPDLRDLTQCTFVKDTFSDILSHQCRPFMHTIKLLWASTLSLSIIMVILGLAWVTKVYQDRGKSFSRCSLIPRSAVN
ncbi:hypothetical protein BVC80_8347g6 [Macleaya cordata]|uniref:Uncharacterized protein n=1 Tax=Macleaya cordata TaxID=56857 RepID=A0A200QMZ0_MACCD|nr:hypothetical protein BVC80_8347g6 [Macleaya cordata]